MGQRQPWELREGTEGRPGGHGIRAGAEGSPGSDLGSCSQRTCGISRVKAREKEAAGRGSPCVLPAVGREWPAAIRLWSWLSTQL